MGENPLAPTTATLALGGPRGFSEHDVTLAAAKTPIQGRRYFRVENVTDSVTDV